LSHALQAGQAHAHGATRLTEKASENVTLARGDVHSAPVRSHH
jgi:hypothetical protein